MQIKILSWNIWCDGYFDEIKKFLESSNADIIALQEVLPNSKKIPVIDFLVSLGYKYVCSPSMDMTLANGEVEKICDAVFSKYKIVCHKSHVLSDERKRITVQADIELPTGIFHVFSFHPIHTHQKPSELQDSQIQNLMKVLPKEKTLVMGDFNATPNSKAIKIIGETLKNTDSDMAPTWSVYPEGCSICKPQKIDTRLDYIFASTDVKTSLPKVESSKGSDHLPISLVVEI